MADVDECEKQVQAAKLATPAPERGAARKKNTRGAKDHLLAEVVRKYLPNVPIATLAMETEWHTRWKGVYPRTSPPYSCSAPYAEGNDESIRAALMTVLAWTWAEHTKSMGEVCPYELA